MFYSKTTGGFYDPAIHGTAMPIDVVEITTAEHAALMAGQAQGKSIVADGSGRPVLSNPSAAVVKDGRWQLIKAERDRRKNGGVLVSGNWFHTDPDSRIQIMGLVILGANIPVGTNWKTMAKNPDGSAIFVAMTRDLANSIFQAIADLDKVAFAKAEEHRAAMEASGTPATYDFSGGWPAIFVG